MKPATQLAREDIRVREAALKAAKAAAAATVKALKTSLAAITPLHATSRPVRRFRREEEPSGRREDDECLRQERFP